MGAHCKAMDSISLTDMGLSMVHNISRKTPSITADKLSEEAVKVKTIWLTIPIKEE